MCICQEVKGVGCLETLAGGTACELAWRGGLLPPREEGERGCPGNTRGLVWLAGLGWGRWQMDLEGKQSLHSAEYSRTAKELIFYQLGQYPQLLGSCLK